jgi:hypothetical protein
LVTLAWIYDSLRHHDLCWNSGLAGNSRLDVESRSKRICACAANNKLANPSTITVQRSIATSFSSAIFRRRHSHTGAITMSNKASPSQIISDKPSDTFRKAVRQILSVPKKELEEREAKYQAARKLKSAKKHGA